MRTWLTGTVIALTTTGALTMTAGAPASARPTPHPEATTAARTGHIQGARAAADADGRLHAWEHQFGGGLHCSWSGPSYDWSICKGNGINMRNNASDLWNNGVPDENADDVFLHYETHYRGAWVCIGRGTSWNNLSDHHNSGQRVTFNAGTGTGAGEPINNRVSSHEWGSC